MRCPAAAVATSPLRSRDGDGLGEVALGARRVAGAPDDAADANEQPARSSLALDVRQRPQQQLGRLREALTVLGLAGCLEPDRHGLREPAGREEMARPLAGRRVRAWSPTRRPPASAGPVGEARRCRRRRPPASARVGSGSGCRPASTSSSCSPTSVTRASSMADRSAAETLGQQVRSHGDTQAAEAWRTSTDRLRQPLDALEDRLADRGRQSQLFDLTALPAGRRPVDVAAIDGVLEQLLEHERVALAALEQHVAELGLTSSLAKMARTMDATACPSNGSSSTDDTTPARRQPWTRGAKGCRRWSSSRRYVASTTTRVDAQSAGEEVEQLARRGVGPVDVLDDEQHPAIGCLRPQELEDRLEEAQAAPSDRRRRCRPSRAEPARGASAPRSSAAGPSRSTMAAAPTADR